jgi:hypothetical protein
MGYQDEEGGQTSKDVKVMATSLGRLAVKD